MSDWQCCWGQGRLVAWLGEPSGHVNPLPSLLSEVLMRRASLLAEAAVLRQQNSELWLLLEEYVSAGVSGSILLPWALGTPRHVCPTQRSQTREPLPGTHCWQAQGASPRR